MSEEYEEAQNGDDSGMTGPGAPTPLSALEVCIILIQPNRYVQILIQPQQGVGGLTKRDIQLVTDGGFQTVESVAYTPKRVLEQIKGISEQKATKILTEGMSLC